ncbi:uncharacterized protein LOC135389651 [Ornithodoros turicata]|uniref:uncharacterized protein LOC135389651 n=1 Tax=Ornithodoros turicata TaxID=34597 RepID=UPI003138F71B
MFEASSYYPKTQRGRPRVPAEKAMLMTLSYLGFQDPIVKIADKFNTTESAVHTSVIRVLNFLQHISSTVIAWPDEERRALIQEGFQEKVTKGPAIPNVIGCVDGSHIEVKKPRKSPDSYFNRKKYHSVVLQGICDHQMKFLDVFVGFPGSAHDARILRNSFFFADASRKCAGDSAYPLLPWLLTPYKNIGQALPSWQKKYNFVHSQQRVTIEHAFGMLKQRFRRLYYVDADSIHQVCLVVMGACVLHNMCTEADDIEDIRNLPQNEESTAEEPDQVDEIASQVTAKEVRKQIARSL